MMNAMSGIELYNKVKTPPDGTTKPIEGGNLAGYTNINPQWRIQALTETYGLCGFGWKFDVTNKETYNCPDGKILLYLEVALYVRMEEGGPWSEPIYGWGGDMIIEKNKNGLVANDEAYKMALTDALGNAAKCLGVGADVYAGKFDGSKYNKGEKGEYSERKKIESPQAKPQAAAATTPQAPAQQASTTERRNEHGELLISAPQQKRMFALSKGNAEIVKNVLMRHGYVKSADVTRHDYNKICEEIEDMAKAG